MLTGCIPIWPMDSSYSRLPFIAFKTFSKLFFQLYDIIQPGVVTWPKVHKKFNRMKKFMEKLENCNYVVDLGRKQKFSLVGIAG